jgi:hypothetical protein
MGIRFDRVLEDFDGPFETIPDQLAPPPGRVDASPAAAGYLLSHRLNDSFVAINRLLKGGVEVFLVREHTSADGVALGRGAIFVPAVPAALPLITTLARDVGLTFHATASRPAALVPLRPVRVGLWDRYGGSMPSGWIRWILEQYEFPFEVVYPATLDAGDLKSRFDVLIFPDEAIPERDGGPRPAWDNQPAASDVPEEYRPVGGQPGRPPRAPAHQRARRAHRNG